MIRFFVHHPTAANILMVIFLVSGLATLPSMMRETFPEIKKFEVSVSVLYPSASAKDIEESICQPLEEATDGISFTDEKRCEAKDNIGIMTLKMQESGDMSQFIDDIKTAVDGIDSFPDNTETPIIKELGRTDPVVAIAIAADIPKPELKKLAEDLKQKLQQLPHIAIVNIEGFSEHQLIIEVPQHNLLQYGLSINDIATAIRAQATDLPSGDIESENGIHQIRFMEKRRTPEQLASLRVISSQNGGEIRLADIATISDSFEHLEDKITFNGKPAAILQIQKNKHDDSLTLLEEIKTFISEQNKTLPEGISLHLTRDMTSIVEDRLKLIVKNGWQGIILVSLALYLFFSWRYTFWVALGLPVSFLGSFALITAFGISINMISLVGLLISIGILMDDAIVISESIATEYAKGKSPADAAIDGTTRVARGVLSSFATTVFIFSGLAFLQGDIGQVLKVMPVVLISVLSVSLVEAFCILPHHLMHSLHHNQKEPFKWKQKFTDLFEKTRHKVGRLADMSVRYRYGAVGLTIALLLFSISMLATGVLKFKAFPDLDGDVVQARILLPQGTPLSRTEAVVNKVIHGLQQVDQQLEEVEGQRLLKNITVSYNQNQDAFETGTHIATISVDLLSADQRQTTMDTLTRLWRAEVGDVADVINIQYKQPTMGPAGRAIEIRLQGNDLEQLSSASYELQNWLRGYNGVVDVMDDLRQGKPQLNISLLPGNLVHNLPAESIAKQLRAAYQGVKIDDIQYEGEDYELQVKLDLASRDSLADFENMRIYSTKGETPIPLRAVAEITEDRSYARIHRIDNMRAVTVYGDVDADIANTNQVLLNTQKEFFPQLKNKYPDVKITLEGEVKNAAVTGGSLRKGFLLGAIGIFLLLSLQFRNYLEPIIVMLAIPLAFIGVIWGHIIMGLDLTMPSVMGFVSLAGIVVNDSILLVESVKQRAAEGFSVHDAASQASRDRFRAIFLTSFTTIAGIAPLLLESSLQAQVLIPLVTSIGFGLIASTLLVLVVLPAMYSILEDFGFTEN
ncbi:efflux RND transporter permease subunit [Teredinibacter sp. KSP-S5-2]|uniref:efflux RND transporter permease subunit n=1 Tax=Teredinibacter sp. KSP-S5-2 TaxID=3034506 RepID=UPI002934A76D|nr:efflux RND transporter permease subunit [Teredinibacter sp. KSP-S5-2]WNO08934.1 efflux RND transporter permease subunit [Teredinibacter sp. KSP-S5-2]